MSYHALPIIELDLVLLPQPPSAYDRAVSFVRIRCPRFCARSPGISSDQETRLANVVPPHLFLKLYNFIAFSATISISLVVLLSLGLVISLACRVLQDKSTAKDIKRKRHRAILPCRALAHSSAKAHILGDLP